MGTRTSFVGTRKAHVCSHQNSACGLPNSAANKRPRINRLVDTQVFKVPCVQRGVLSEPFFEYLVKKFFGNPVTSKLCISTEAFPRKPDLEILEFHSSVPSSLCFFAPEQLFWPQKNLLGCTATSVLQNSISGGTWQRSQVPEQTLVGSRTAFRSSKRCILSKQRMEPNGAFLKATIVSLK